MLNKKILSLIVLLYGLLCLNASTCIAQKQVFQAGAAMVNITPPKGSKLLGGRTVHDILYAKPLVLDDGNQKLVFVVVDNQGIPEFVCDAARQKISKSTGIPLSNILISATHTHTGIAANPAPFNLNKDGKYTEYQSLLVQKITASVQKAIANLQPAQIGWGKFNKPEYVFNRRWYMKKPVTNPFGLLDSVKMNPGYGQRDKLDKPAGPTDPQVSFIAVRSISGEPIAVLANYSIHYIGGAAPKNISADYYGEFGKQLGLLLNTKNNKFPFVGIMSNGTSGDVSHNNYAAIKPQQRPYEEIISVAKDLARNVVEQYTNQIQFHNWVPLQAMTSNITLELRRPSNEITQNTFKIKQNSQKKTLYNSEEKNYAKRVDNLVDKYPKTALFTLQTFKIGELGIAAIPFEVFAETGLTLKQKSPFKNFFTIGLANGHWGYLPTPGQYKKGGYETWITVSRAQENASDIITENILKQLSILKEN